MEDSATATEIASVAVIITPATEIETEGAIAATMEAIISPESVRDADPINVRTKSKACYAFNGVQRVHAV